MLIPVFDSALASRCPEHKCVAQNGENLLIKAISLADRPITRDALATPEAVDNVASQQHNFVYRSTDLAVFEQSLKQKGDCFGYCSSLFPSDEESIFLEEKRGWKADVFRNIPALAETFKGNEGNFHREFGRIFSKHFSRKCVCQFRQSVSCKLR